MEEWLIRRMEELCEITSSKRIYASDYVPEGVPFYRGKEISEKYHGKSAITTELFIRRSQFEKLRDKFGAPAEGDLLLTSIGALLGLPYVVRNNEEFYFKDGNLLWFRHFRNLDSRFLYYWMLSPSGKAQLAKSRIGSAQPAFTINLLKQMQIHLPPVSMQRRVCQALEAYDDLIENNQRRIQILEGMARRLYREWFVHFRFPGHENHPRIPSPLGEIPQGWEAVPFTDISDVLSGGTPKTDIPDYWNGDIPFFTPRDAPAGFYVSDCDKHVTELGVSKCASQLYPPDTVFITARGTVGKVALPSVPMAMNQSCYALRGKVGVSQRFLFLMTLQQVDYLRTNTGGATFSTIVVDTFKRMVVVKPEREVIAKFTSLVGGMFDEARTLHQQTINLRATRDLLLPRLLSGQIKLEAN